jgi:DNA excision repair protein ERCC-2
MSLSVHDIVDVLLRRGHIDTRIFNQSSMQEGTRLHALYQREQQDGYIPEYSLSHTFRQEDFTYCVSGKADGVVINPSNKKEVMVEEIKTTVAPLDEFIKDHGQWHLGQAMFYAYMIAYDRNLNHVEVVMTYLRQQNYKEQKQISHTYTYEELQRFVEDLILRYTRFQKKLMRFKEIRDESTIGIHFPFGEYRKGQKEMMDLVRYAADSDTKVYVEAPTGIGKTISVLYPLIERFGEKKQDKIFYLTSKNAIKKVAMNSLSIMEGMGVKCKSIEFTSKENFCFNDKKGHCNPDECPFARHYYDKLMDAIFDSLELHNTFDRSTLTDICFHREMCPFEFQLDLSRYCDCLVIDYSYVFDFHDRLELENGSIARSRTTLLVDECHNLPDRVRDMYSLELYPSSLEDVLPSLGRNEFALLKDDVKKIREDFPKFEIDLDDEDVKKEHVQVLNSLPNEFLTHIENFIEDMKPVLKKHALLIDDHLLEFFFKLNNFYFLTTLALDENTKNQYLIYLKLNYQNELSSIRIANLDSRKIITEKTALFSSSIFFSATLSPKEYHIDLLGGRIEENNHLFLPSPFSFENRKIFIDTRLSLRYRDRNDTIYQVYNLCKSAISAKKGNYFIFCPSFDYLQRLSSFFQEEEDSYELIIQSRNLKDSQREEFLSAFSSDNERTTIGLLVLGGVFSEGIDLVGERLIGAIIISAGLPQIGFERNHLKEYFDKEEGDKEKKKGFTYAYTYPGINRILQAGGRVIRSENDRGFVIYIDSRFSQPTYQKVFKEIYPDAIKVISPSQVKTQIKEFFKKEKQE